MANYSSNDFKPGLKVMLEGDPCAMVDVEFVKPGKGQAFTRVRMKNLKSGRVWASEAELHLHTCAWQGLGSSAGATLWADMHTALVDSRSCTPAQSGHVINPENANFSSLMDRLK